METRTLDTVIYEKDGPVAWIILNYPEKANIQSSSLVFDVDTCLDDADRDYDIKVVVLKANGLMRATAVGAGTHRIVYVYDPASIRLGAVISLVALVALAAACFWARRG